MSKKDGSELKSNKIVGFSNWSGGFGGPIYNDKEMNYDPHRSSNENPKEKRNENKFKSFFKRVQDKLFNNNTPLQQNKNNLTPIKNEQPEIEEVNCHICGNSCNNMDYFCKKCGAKLKVGHYND